MVVVALCRCGREHGDSRWIIIQADTGEAIRS
jgi:hypothetical protein